MKKYLTFIGCLLFAFTHSFSQNRIIHHSEAKSIIPFASEIQYNNHSETPTTIIFNKESKITKEQFFLVSAKALNASKENTWKLDAENKDDLGFTHYRYRQYYHQVKVEPGQYFLHVRNGFIEKANGKFFDKIDINPTPTLSSKMALEYALEYCGASSYKWEIPSEENWIKEHEHNPLTGFYPQAELVIMAKDAQFLVSDMRLCWKFDIYAHEPMSRAFYYIDAHTGELVFKQDRICTGVATGTAVTKYSGTREIITDSTAINNFRLRDASRGAGVETYDMNNGTSYGASVDFTDTDNFWNNVNAQQDEAATDAHWGAANTYDYYLNIHNRNSYNNLGSVIKSYVHYNTNYANAFWNGSVMTYGDGNGTSSTPFTALDVVGHEITHGVTEFSSDLVYAYESGALNESFSDIFGAAIEFYALGTANGDWIVGEDMTISGTGIRNMMNPNSKGDPDTYLGSFWHTSSSDNGGVHTNSGVQNYWFYLLTQGGSGINDNNNAYSVTGLGILKAAKIAYRNNNVYLTSGSQYADARSGSIQAAIDLYGPCSPEVEATTNAWYAVGVGPAYVAMVIADFESDITTSCSAPFTFNFSNLSNNASTFTWYFGDGTTSGLTNPAHTYNSFGSFDVKLVSDGGVCGLDSIEKTTFITIDSLSPCNALVGDPTQSGCSGVLFDPGGPGSNYDDNLNVVTTIAPTDAATVTLVFNTFNVEPGSGSTCNYDYVEIFDGPNTSSPSFGRFCNTTGSPGTINSTGPALTVKFYSDAAVTHSGFDATWACTLNSVAPIAGFSAPITQACDGVISFANESAGLVDSVHWDFGDGFTSNNFNATHTYLTSGTYTVSLYVSNANGSTTETKTNYITIFRPAAPSVNDESNCGASSFTLNAGTTTINWYDAIVGGNLLGTGTTYTTPLLNSTTNYYAEELVPAIVQTLGPIDNSFGGGAYFSGNQSLIFNCFKPTKLISVWVNAQSTGTRTVELRNATGSVIQDTAILISNVGGQQITLNFDIPVGSDLQLGIDGFTDLYRNNANLSYPYEIPGLISITRSTASSNPVGFYYFFYNWIVQGPPCPSERDVVTAVIYDDVTATSAVTNNACYGGLNGAINVNVSTGTSPFSYMWNTGATSSSLTNLAAGNYTVTITDNNGCATEAASSLTDGSEIILTSSKKNVSCAGGSDGTSTVIASGGTAPYTVTWNTNPVQTSSTINNLSPAFYSAMVTDSNGCQQSIDIEIRVPDLLVSFYIPTNPIGANSNGQINLLVTGGINPYTYLWSNGATTEDLVNLGPGAYFSTVIDRNGCAVLNTVTLTSVPFRLNPQPMNFEKSTINKKEIIKIIPNPTGGNTEIQFELEESGYYKIQLLDITGREVFHFRNESEVSGVISAEFDLSFLRTGLYVVKCSTDKKVYTEKLMKN